MKKKYVDLSHTIKNGEVTYKGLPAPLVCDYLTREESKPNYEEGTSFQIGKIEMLGNTGTYLDCPFHRYEDGDDLSALPIHQLADIEGILIEAPYQDQLEVGIERFKGLELRGKAILVYTGWSNFWQTDNYFEHHPYLSEGAASFLVEQEVALVGIDSHNIDNTNWNRRPVHSSLLKNNILIVEHLTNLKSLLDLSFTFTAIPPKIESFGTFPVRAFATLK